jgi:uncharacterized protein (TIGR02147 family)
MERPDIFLHDDYRAYLKEWFEWMKTVKKGFSHRVFARMAGFKSPNCLQLIITKRRHISPSTISKYLNVLKLKKKEEEYFELLFRFNTEDDMATKAKHLKELTRYWSQSKKEFTQDQYECLTQWYYFAIRELVDLKDFSEDGKWISKKLKNRVEPGQAESALQTLLQLNLLTRDENGRLKQTDKVLNAKDEMHSVLLFLHHHQFIRLSAEALNDPASQRYFNTISFTIRKDDYQHLVDEVRDFKERMVNYLQSREVQGEDEDLFHINVNLFPLTSIE